MDIHQWIKNIVNKWLIQQRYWVSLIYFETESKPHYQTTPQHMPCLLLGPYFEWFIVCTSVVLKKKFENWKKCLWFLRQCTLGLTLAYNGCRLKVTSLTH